MKSRKRSTFRTRKAKPETIPADTTQMVTKRLLDPSRSFPLLVQPAMRDLDHLSWLANQRTDIEKMLQKHGAILFRGFAVDGNKEFEAFAGALCDQLYGEYGDLPPDQGNVYKVTPYPHKDRILFHSESSHMHCWPTKQFFYCRLPAASGGTTPIVDCRQVYKALDPEFVAKLSEHGLRYERYFHPGVDVDWREFFKTEDREEVAAKCRKNGIELKWYGDVAGMSQWAPGVATHPQTGEQILFNQIQLHHISYLPAKLRAAVTELYPANQEPRNVYFGDGTPISDTDAAELERICWEQSIDFPWQKGDVLMVDNMLISHARNPYEPPREMFVVMGDIMHADQLTQVVP